MKESQKPSDEKLSAFVDEQLDTAERDRLFEEFNSDPVLNERVCTYQRLHEMVQHAYSQPPPKKRVVAQPRAFRSAHQALAAGVFLCVGGIVGWLVHNRMTPDPASEMLVPHTGAILHLGQAGAPATDTVGVLLHLNSSDPSKMDAALDRAEVLLKRYETHTPATKVEVLVNGGGLDLLRADVSPHAGRIRALQETYRNITFLACRKALQRLKAEQGIDAELLNSAAVAPSALQQIIDRLQQGWTYVQI